MPESAEDYVYMSQLLQAYGITKGIEAQRRAKPYNMGTLFWQLNDCWPAVSWSSIDYSGNWKALHYKAKRVFDNILVTSEVKDDILSVWVVNDDLKIFEDDLLLKVIDFEGNLLWADIQKIIVNGNSSEKKYRLNLSDLNLDKSEVVAEVYFNNRRHLRYLVKPKDLNLKQAEIQKTITKTDNGFSIELKSETLQKDVFLHTKVKGHFTDNFFDLLPNEAITIDFVTEAATMVLEDFQIKSFNNFIR
jgi:beta-mannosidase